MDYAKKKYDGRKKTLESSILKINEALKREDLGLTVLKGHHSLIARSKERFLLASDNLLEAKLKNDDDNNSISEIELEQTEMFSSAELVLIQLEDKIGEHTNKKEDDVGSHKEHHHHRLPKLELPKFSGDIREWIQFWSQFETVHKDENIEVIVKFQYLIQCMKIGSTAYEIVTSYPVSDKNYPLVVQSLLDRFGREDILVEVYVRDLIKLIMNNKSNDFSSLYMKLSSQIRALGSLGVTTDKCASILYPIVESTLPEDVLIAWERHRMQAVHINGKVTSEDHLNQLMQFLQDEVAGKERIRLARQGLSTECTSTRAKQPEKGNRIPATAAAMISTERRMDPCLFCEKDHPSQDCCKAQNLSNEEKQELVKSKRRCFFCLRSGHVSKKCRQFVKCLCCGGRHWTIMCKEMKNTATISKSVPAIPEVKKTEKTTSTSMCSYIGSPTRVLQTVLMRIHGEEKIKIVRAILDSCSEKSYVLESTAEELRLQPVGEEKIVHLLFGGIETLPEIHRQYQLELSSLDFAFSCQLDVCDKKKISGYVRRVPPGPWLEELSSLGISLSDAVGTHCEDEIEILIGSDIYGRILTGRKVDLKSGPSAIETKLGWTLLGRLQGKVKNETDKTFHTIAHHVLDTYVTDLWTLDIIGIKDPEERVTKQEKELAAMTSFLDTVKFNEDGRYVVQLPWYPDHPPLPTNRAMAENRLIAVTKELKSKNKLSAYDEVFKMWLANGIIEEVPSDEIHNYGHYLGHRPVFKPGSTTSIRPVFNASARTKSTPSLNDCLEKGPNFLEEIPAHLIRFRMYKVGVIADIEKAFLQLMVDLRDRDFLRFLWWEDSNCVKKKMFRHCRVVFGVSSSPFLLAATLKHLLNSREGATVDILTKSFYVDNVVASLPSVEQAEIFKEEATSLLASAKFNLRGWEIGPNEEEKIVPVLGLCWNTKTDVLSCDVKKFQKIINGPVTKRIILSLAHAIFDPLGVVCAFTIFPKLLMQEAWKLKIGWDNELPADLSKKFLSWTAQLNDLEGVEIPRNFCHVDKSTWSLHVFTDASKDAYAACVFIRSGLPGNIQVQLIMAKSRVASLKNWTIPRLELLACGIGVRLYDTVIRSMQIQDVPVYFWSDSTTALAWIKREDNWSRFVSNRVAEIKKLCDATKWSHVSGKLNPADLPSRGARLSNLVEIRWWEGPRWLYQEREFWPNADTSPDENEIETEKKKTTTCLLTVESSDVLEKVLKLSDYHKMIRVTALCLRFINNLKSTVEKKPAEKKVDVLELEEIQGAELQLLRFVQRVGFPSGLKDEKLKLLKPFLDGNGIIRIKTRVIDRDEDFSCPIVLPSKDPVVWYLIWKYHIINCHAGTGILQSQLRQRFWILNGRRTIRNVILGCCKCRRFRAQNCGAPQPPLPDDRVRTGPPFDVTGVDMAGPLFVKGNRKVYIAIFTCASYRGIHLELVSSLTAEGFLLALRRFIARRGRPSTIYSDNGLNFVGVRNLFAGVDWKKIASYTTVQQIRWKLNPPASPWWGGWWERLIGIVKQMLRSILGSSRVNSEELQTLLCDVESQVNQRPLTYVSNDNDDLMPLTPDLFMRNGSVSVLPEADLSERDKLNSHHHNMQSVRDELKTRFRKEYLAQLVHQGKRKKYREVKVGDVVLIGNDLQKRLDWPMGVVKEVIRGRDGVVRVARIKTNNGEFLRPVQRLYFLEINEND